MGAGEGEKCVGLGVERLLWGLCGLQGEEQAEMWRKPHVSSPVVEHTGNNQAGAIFLSFFSSSGCILKYTELIFRVFPSFLLIFSLSTPLWMLPVPHSGH